MYREGHGKYMKKLQSVSYWLYITANDTAVIDRCKFPALTESLLLFIVGGFGGCFLCVFFLVISSSSSSSFFFIFLFLFFIRLLFIYVFIIILFLYYLYYI